MGGSGCVNGCGWLDGRDSEWVLMGVLVWVSGLRGLCF